MKNVAYRLMICMFALAGLGWAQPANDPAGEVASLKQHIAQARPQEKPYLYAQLVRNMVELADRQFTAGDVARAHRTVVELSGYADAAYQSTEQRGAKKLKNAQILMRETARRLNDIMRTLAAEDQPQVQAAVKHIEQAETQLLVEFLQH